MSGMENVYVDVIRNVSLLCSGPEGLLPLSICLDKRSIFRSSFGLVLVLCDLMLCKDGLRWQWRHQRRRSG